MIPLIIKLTPVDNGEKGEYINATQIVEFYPHFEKPVTVIQLTSNRVVFVTETPEEIYNKIVGRADYMLERFGRIWEGRG